MNSPDEEEIEGIDCSPCCRSERLKFIVVSLLLGQILSLCLCGTGVSSQFLASKYNVETPTTQSFISYLLLCLVYGTILAFKPETSDGQGLMQVFRKRWWKYAILAFIDVQANFLVVKAYQYTNLASIQVLDCFTIPVVLVLSFIFLYVRYLLSHILGVAICLIGIGCLVWGDVVNGKGVGGSDKLLGDIFCLSGAALYGVSNVAEEKLVKRFSRTEYLGMIGIFGSVISGIQLALIERENLAKVPWHHYEIIILYLAFALCMFTFYSLVTIVIQRTSAAMYNLNILTADFYTLLAGLVIFEYSFHYLYFASFLLVLVGSVVYSLKPTRSRAGALDLVSMPEPPAPPVVDEETFVNSNGYLTTNYSARYLLDAQRQEAGGSSQNSSMANVSRDIGAIVQEAGDDDVKIRMCRLHGPVIKRD